MKLQFEHICLIPLSLPLPSSAPYFICLLYTRCVPDTWSEVDVESSASSCVQLRHQGHLVNVDMIFAPGHVGRLDGGHGKAGCVEEVSRFDISISE